MIYQEKNSLSWFEFELFAPYRDRLRHGCFTRKGGVSRPPFDSLNVGYSVEDSTECVTKNRRRLLELFHATPDQLIDVRQVHGVTTYIDNSSNLEKNISENEKRKRSLFNLWQSTTEADPADTDQQEGDIILSRQPGKVLMIKHADCQAAIFYDPIHHAVAVAHAGWRGQTKKAYTVTLRHMAHEWGTHPKDVLVGISPSLGYCHSEFISWKQEFPEWAFPFASNNYMDLKALARHELIKAGIQEKNIEISPLCTFEREDLFFSYRRDGMTGRLASCAQLLK